MADIAQTIQATIDQNDVVLFMKGTADMPQCGFSAMVAGILQQLDVVFKDVNVLACALVRINFCGQRCCVRKL